MSISTRIGLSFILLLTLAACVSPTQQVVAALRAEAPNSVLWVGLEPVTDQLDSSVLHRHVPDAADSRGFADAVSALMARQITEITVVSTRDQSMRSSILLPALRLECSPAKQLEGSWFYGVVSGREPSLVMWRCERPEVA